MVNIPNIAYPDQHVDTEVTHFLKDHAVAPDTVNKTAFILDLEPIDDKRHSIVNSVGRALVKK